MAVPPAPAPGVPHPIPPLLLPVLPGVQAGCGPPGVRQGMPVSRQLVLSQSDPSPLPPPPCADFFLSSHPLCHEAPSPAPRTVSTGWDADVQFHTLDLLSRSSLGL